MKFRSIAVTAALFAFVYLAPASFAADNDSTAKASTPAATAPVEPSATKISHDGGMDDLDAIGNRNVGCAKGMGNWYGLEGQIALGKQVSMQVETQS
jgi:hypothetical protein